MSSTELPGWGRRAGHLSLACHVDRVARIEMFDRMLALDVAHRYAWACDERDITLFDEVLTQDVVFTGCIAGSTSVGPIRGRESVVSWLRGHMKDQADQRRHTMQNEVVSCQSAGAIQITATLLLTSSDGTASTVVTSGFYVMDVRQDGDEAWRISRVFAGFDNPF